MKARKKRIGQTAYYSMAYLGRTDTKENNSVIIRWERLLVPTLHLLWDHLRLKMILQLNRPTGYIK